MDSELLKKLITEPEHWLFYLCLGGVIMFILKIIGVAADAVAKHLSAKVKGENRDAPYYCQSRWPESRKRETGK